MSDNDHTLEALIELHNEIIVLSEDYWVKFEAKRVKESRNKPYGIKYSLTLHDKKGERVIGFDNAHKIPGLIEDVAHDHKHHVRHKNRLKIYHYISAAKLIEDFWKEVDEYLRE